MTGDRHLEAQGLGERSYDYANDILYFKIKNRNYAESLEFGNIIVDIDDQQFITGIRILDASTVLRIPKYGLNNIQEFAFTSRFDREQITVQLNFSCALRNKMIQSHGQDILREAPFAVKEPHTVTAEA
jgi:uncharacterized protein YuzE